MTTRRWMRDPDLFAGRDRGVAVAERTHIWFVPDGEAVAHAQPIGPGWMRSACRKTTWTVKSRSVTNADPRCDDCVRITREGES